MIKAIHALIYSDDTAATRAFLRDVLRWPFVASADDEPEWLIFKSGPSEVGVHPTRGEDGVVYAAAGHHDVSFMCDDLATTMAELTARGAQFAGEPLDMGFGLGVLLKVPGAGEMLLYEARHNEAYSLE